MGADPFADDAAPSDGGLFGGGAAVSASPDLFAPRSPAPAMASASPFAGGVDSGVVSSGPSPRMDAGQAMMTGARNENSVLFSLKNLQALATGSGASMPSPAIAPERTGYASGEGSGLIDIRALATSTGVGENAEGGGARDELLSMGSHGGAFGALGSPMLSAGAADEGDGSRKLLIWAGVAAVGFVSAAAVAIIALMRPTAPPPAPVDLAATTAPAPAAVAVAQPLPAAATTPSEGEQAAARAAAEGHSSGSERSSGSGERRRRSSSSESGSTKSGDGDPMAVASAGEPKAAPSKPGGPKSLDELLEGALSGGSSKGKTAAAADTSGLPKQPSRDQVRSAMKGVEPAVKACSTGGGGVAIVTVSVAGETGRVTNATVSGVTGPAGSCIARAARGASFPKFQQSTFKISFPFKL
jgi:hypothetical protein